MLFPTTRRVSMRTRSFTRFQVSDAMQLDFPSWSDPKRKAEELSFRGARNRALGLIDAKLQPRIEATHRLHHTLARPLRPGSSEHSQFYRAPSVLPSALRTASAPEMMPLSRLGGWPMRSPVNASPRPSRVTAHDSGSMWIASPSSWWTCTSYFLPE